MSRTIQGVIFSAILITAVIGILLLANVGAETEACALALSLETVGCFLRRYKELAAGLVGAAGALMAAWIAWVAVQRQIRQTAELATASERQALQVIRAELEVIVRIVNTLWRTTDFALKWEWDRQATSRERAKSFVQRAFDLPSPERSIVVIKEFSPSVGPGARRLIAMIVYELERFYGKLDRQATEKADLKFYSELRWVRRFCTRIDSLIALIDPQLVTELKSRIRDEIPYGEESPDFISLVDTTFIMQELDEEEAKKRV